MTEYERLLIEAAKVEKESGINIDEQKGENQ